MRISIITVSYNSENTIERTLESVLNQTQPVDEYIIVDGSSRDSTVKIIKKYEPFFKGRMRWISEPDKGIYNAMNKGIKMTTGDIIGIVNSDDWLEPNTVEIVKNEIQKQKHPLDKIYTGEVLFHYCDGKVQKYKASKERFEKKAKEYCMGINHPATFVPRVIYDKLGVFDERFKLYADSDFVLRCFENKVDFIFVNKILSNMSDGGASNKRSNQMLRDTILRYKVHSKSKWEYLYLITKCKIRWYLSPLIPEWLVRAYRKKTHIA